MRKFFYLTIITLAITIPIIFSTAFIPKYTSSENVVEDQCNEWQKSSYHNIQFRWCKDPEVFNSTSYQFFNGYHYKVWYYFRLDYTNGESFTGNTILDSGEYSDKGSMYKRTPSRWTIEKKQKKDDTGKWVYF